MYDVLLLNQYTALVRLYFVEGFISATCSGLYNVLNVIVCFV